MKLCIVTLIFFNVLAYFYQLLSRGQLRTLAVAAGVALAVFVVMVTTIQKDTQIGIELSDQNMFESEPAWDANWDIDEFRHHFVQTERMQTEVNKKRDDAIENLDKKVEVRSEVCRVTPKG